MRDGGAALTGGGIVGNVKFGETAGIGGHIGYRLDPALSVSISYQHTRGDIGWDANFPLFGVASSFEGSAASDAVLGNVVYNLILSDMSAVRATAGLGVAFNSLSGVIETDKATGLFVSYVTDHTRVSPMAQIGGGIQYKITANAVLGLDASIAYTGGFETGNTRSGNLGITGINPYKIDDVWRTNLSASIRFEF